jgi:hypothetical protein
MPLIHSYNRDIAGVVRIRLVSGGSNLRTRRGSRGVSVANYNMVRKPRVTEHRQGFLQA